MVMAAIQAEDDFEDDPLTMCIDRVMSMPLQLSWRLSRSQLDSSSIPHRLSNEDPMTIRRCPVSSGGAPSRGSVLGLLHAEFDLFRDALGAFSA